MYSWLYLNLLKKLIAIMLMRSSSALLAKRITFKEEDNHAHSHSHTHTHTHYSGTMGGGGELIPYKEEMSGLHVQLQYSNDTLHTHIHMHIAYMYSTHH